MTNSQRLAAVRARFLRWMGESATEPRNTSSLPDAPESPILRESILVRDDFFVGRRFHTDDFDAVWFIEEDQLKIYRRGGELLCVLGSTDIDATPAAEGAIEGDQLTESDQQEPVILKLPAPRPTTESAQDENSVRRAA